MDNHTSCTNNLMSQWAVVNDNLVHVKNYINKKSSEDSLQCRNGHDLILVNGEINIPHFRHKNPTDSPMSTWHKKWQNNFLNTEKGFKKKDKQLKDRRADVFIDIDGLLRQQDKFNPRNRESRYDEQRIRDKYDGLVVEIQHSPIEKKEVSCRKSDYALNGMETVWVVDGNTKDVELEELSDVTFLITFNERWKYISFCGLYKYVLLDIDDKIFKIPVDEVCNNMISVKQYIPIDDVVKSLKTNFPDMWNMWSEDEEVFPTLTRIQKGAGNGKTYGIWKSICSNPDKELFIITTKTHSAKDTIYAELNDQVKRDETHVIENMEDTCHGEHGKQLLVTYIHKVSRRKCSVIIGTIDSFGWGLAKTNKKTCNWVEGLWNTITVSGCDKVNPITGSMRYAGKSLKLNRKVQLWIDEAQDLDVDYMRGIVRMMLETKTDVIIVGDKLQSLKHKENFISSTETDGLPNIRIINETPINVNRRIKNQGVARPINKLINFDLYGVPPISMEAENSLEDWNTEGLEVIEADKITKSDEGKDKLSNYITHILSYVDKEVQKHNYKANNFLFMFPIVSDNILATELETRLNKYWIEKNDNITNEYIQYVVFHKSEDGKPIDITRSEHASRIMSIDAAKGGQREVVFVLGCNEETLKKRSRSDNVDVVYESFLHVAVTRAKHKTYFALERNHDEIHRRFGKCGYVEYKPIIKTRLNVSNMIDGNNYSDKLIACMEKNGVHELDSHNNNEMKPNIDWEYYCIRRAVYLNYSMFGIIHRSDKMSNNFKESQLHYVLKTLSNLKVCRLEPTEFYSVLNKWKDLVVKFEYLPLCELSYKPVYAKLCDILENTILKVQEHLRISLSNIENFTPFEATVLHYMVNLFKHRNRCGITPTTMYNICDYFTNMTKLLVTDMLEETTKVKNITDSVLVDIFTRSQGNIHWNIEHYIYLDGNDEYTGIKVRYIPPLIGYDDNTVYHLEYVTDLDHLNYWETMVRILLTRFILANPKGNDREENNISRLGSKDIRTYVFILKQNDYITIEWDWDKTLSSNVMDVIKEIIMNTLTSHHEHIHRWYDRIKKNTKLWSKKYETPMDYAANEFSHVKYVMDIFRDLHSKYLDGDKVNVKNLLNDCRAFCDELHKHANRTCDAFLRPLLHETIDDEEW